MSGTDVYTGRLDAVIFFFYTIARSVGVAKKTNQTVMARRRKKTEFFAQRCLADYREVIWLKTHCRLNRRD